MAIKLRKLVVQVDELLVRLLPAGAFTAGKKAVYLLGKAQIFSTPFAGLLKI